MIKRSKKDVDRLVEKWDAVLNGPYKPLSACKCIIMESQEKIHTIDEVINSISSEVFDQYVENFKHEGDTNPDGYLSLLIKHKLRKENELI